MPTAVTGYTRNEFIAQLQDIVGNNSNTFLTQCQDNITAWVQQFYTAYDWNFCLKNGVNDNFKFTTVSGQSTYTINTANFGFESNATYIESIYSQNPGQTRKLIKFEIQELRTGDPGQIATGYPFYWFPVTEKEILIYPTPSAGTAGETLYCDGKVLGLEINSNVSIPVPYQKQDLFLQFCLYKCLRRERDPRTQEEYTFYKQLLSEAIQDDMRNEDTNLRVRTVNEQLGPGVPSDLNYRLWYTPNSSGL